MPEMSQEWEFVQELQQYLDEMNPEQQQFIEDLFMNLDPYGDPTEELSEKQIDWLHRIYDYYCNENEDAFEGFDE